MQVILCCGSAGGMEEMLQLVEDIPVGFEAAVVLLLHRKNTPDDLLVDVIEKKTKNACCWN